MYWAVIVPHFMRQYIKALTRVYHDYSVLSHILIFSFFSMSSKIFLVFHALSTSMVGFRHFWRNSFSLVVWLSESRLFWSAHCLEVFSTKLTSAVFSTQQCSALSWHQHWGVAMQVGPPGASGALIAPHSPHRFTLYKLRHPGFVPKASSSLSL